VTDSGIAVVVPTYKHAGTVARTLDSLLRQTRPPTQIIVVNDGSPDDTRAACWPYLERIAYVEQQNRGVSAAMNHGFSLCRHPMVMFLASDDWLEPFAFEQLAPEIEHDREVGLVYGEATVVSAAGKPTGRPFMGAERRRAGKHVAVGSLLEGNFIPAPGTLLRTEAVAAAGPFLDLPYSQDWAMWLRIALRGWSFYGLGRAVAFYEENMDANSNRRAIAADVARMLTVIRAEAGLTEEDACHLDATLRSARRATAWASLPEAGRRQARVEFLRLLREDSERARSLAGLLFTVMPRATWAVTPAGGAVRKL
jgi:glycosyltransferase involved in cell wall biosynthesis